MSTIKEAASKYARGNKDKIMDFGIEAGARFFEWFMSPERKAVRRHRREQRRARRAQK